MASAACGEQRYTSLYSSSDYWLPPSDKTMRDHLQFHSGFPRVVLQSQESPTSGFGEEDDYMDSLAKSLAFNMLLDDDEEIIDNDGEDSSRFSPSSWDPLCSRDVLHQNPHSHKQERSRAVEVKGVNGSNNNNCYLLNNNNNNNSSWDLLRSGSHHENVGVNIPNRIPTQNVPLNAYVGNNKQYFMGENNGECFGYEPSMNVKGWNTMRNIMQPRQRQQKMQAQIQPQFQQQQGKQLSERQARIAAQAAQGRSRNVQAKAITNRSFSPFYGGGGGGGGGHGGSGMSAVFLGSNGQGRESGGTGVFLPRRIDNSHSVKHKPACSTVLLPAKIVQALNLNVADLHSPSYGLSDSSHNRRVYVKVGEGPIQVPGRGRFPEQKVQSKYPDVSERRICSPAERRICSPADDISLPQEWTY